MAAFRGGRACNRIVRFLYVWLLSAFEMIKDYECCAVHVTLLHVLLVLLIKLARPLKELLVQ